MRRKLFTPSVRGSRRGRAALCVPAVLAAVPCAAAGDGDRTEDRRPNIIHIMSDDHAWQAIGAYGHPLMRQAQTPNIDRLASEGMMFRRAYVENSLSTPSRACLMTGLYSHQNGQRRLDGGMDTSVTFMPELLQQSGYTTAVIGKWHMLCEPKGFDYYRILRGQGEYYDPVFKTPDSEGYVRQSGYVTDLITDYAIDFLESRDRSKPFCLFVHHKAPHRNWQPDTRYLDLYEDSEFEVPATFDDDYSSRGPAASHQQMSIDRDMTLVYDLKIHQLRDQHDKYNKWELDVVDSQLGRMSAEQREAWENAYGPRNAEIVEGRVEDKDLARWKYRRYVIDYMRCIRSVDDSVGQLLDYLEREGLLENTVVVYTSDQGFYMGEHGWFDKRFMYEESYRTPLIVRYPSMIDAGTVSDALVQNIDFAPTYLDLAGTDKLPSMSGVSLLPLFASDGKAPEDWRKYLYYHYYDYPAEHSVMRHDGVSDERYKLIHFYGPEGSYDEFYDLQSDSSELHNIIGEESVQSHVERLQRQLEAFRTQLAIDEY